MGYVLIVGANSDIAKAAAREYASHGYDLYLATRNTADIELFAKDLRVREQRTVVTKKLDIIDYKNHQNFYDGLIEKPFGVIMAVGYLGDQSKAQMDYDEAKLIMDTNYTGVVSLLNIIASDLEKRKNGFIVGISSVAGDRGRKSNYIYGSAKAALTAYLSGLRNRLYSSNVQVLTVKPGFVKTKMTEGINLPDKLTTSPEIVARTIYNAQKRGKDVIYIKSIWSYIMIIIKMIPERKFKKMHI